jgi:hypothetical protein
MEIGALCLILAAILVWGTFSARAAVISTPIFFVATGVIMTQALNLTGLESDPHLIKVVAEVTWSGCCSLTPAGCGSPISEPTAGSTCGCWLWDFP